MRNTGIKSGSSDTATGALMVSGPQPVWMTLNEARDRAFTGEVVFEVDPAVFAYLDNGVVYYAERKSDMSLGRRLLQAGVVSAEQLERGTVRVGDVEHLGRLFDRDPSIDRDGVLVVTETSTEDLIAQMANHAVATVRVTAYRHHPSGVHRWFVAPVDAASAQPVSSVVQLDVAAIDRLPDLPVTDPGELTIEWDDIAGVVPDPMADDELMLFDLFGEREAGAFNGSDDATDQTELVDVEAFQVCWPDGTEQSATVENAYVEAAHAPDLAPVDMPEVPAVITPDLAAVVTPDVPAVEEPAFTQTEAGELRFDMPALDLGDEPLDEVPDDVAEAVRRAIAAIESASIESTSIAPLDLEELIDIDIADAVEPDVAEASVLEVVSLDVVTDEVALGDIPTADIPTAEILTAEPPTPEVEDAVIQVPEVPTAEVATEAAPVDVVEVAPFGGFAPPTMATSVEAIYAQAYADAEQLEDVPNVDVAVVTETAPEPSLPAHGVASVVFVDDENPDGGAHDRSSALRRLIGSLRRKDH